MQDNQDIIEATLKRLAGRKYHEIKTELDALDWCGFYSEVEFDSGDVAHLTGDYHYADSLEDAYFNVDLDENGKIKDVGDAACDAVAHWQQIEEATNFVRNGDKWSKKGDARRIDRDTLLIDGEVVYLMPCERDPHGRAPVLKCEICGLPEEEDADGKCIRSLYTQDAIEETCGTNIWCNECIDKMPAGQRP